MQFLWMYFSFQGRITRSQFWAFYLLPTVILGISAALLMHHFKPIISPETRSIIEDIAMVAFVWPSLAIQVKRWHDIDKSGWWILINIIPFVGGLCAFVVNAFFRGTKGYNRFSL